MTDARYEDGNFSDRPVKVAAQDAADVEVISALVQDAVGLVGEISWLARRRRAVLLLNRFRWEDRDNADRQSRAYERVRAALVADDVLRLRAQGVDPGDKETVYSVLSITFEPAEDGSGTLHLALAGDGDLALDVEALDLRLVDLTRPWEARGAPDHGAE